MRLNERSKTDTIMRNSHHRESMMQLNSKERRASSLVGGRHKSRTCTERGEGADTELHDANYTERTWVSRKREIKRFDSLQGYAISSLATVTTHVLTQRSLPCAVQMIVPSLGRCTMWILATTHQMITQLPTGVCCCCGACTVPPAVTANVLSSDATGVELRTATSCFFTQSLRSR